MLSRQIRWLLAAVLCTSCGFASERVLADEAQVYPAAILGFQERGTEVKGLGDKASDLLFAELVANPDLFLLDREDLQKTLTEMKLNLSGVVRPDEAIQVGRLSGAKILITGSVIHVDQTIYVVAKIIGAETSRVLGASVKGDVGEKFGPLIEKLAKDVASTITDRGDQLVAEPASRDSRVAALKEKIGRGKKPLLSIEVAERHVGQAAFDPAAQTELMLLARETGFEVVDLEQGTAGAADLKVAGEGVSEFAGRVGDLISVKARVEVKVVDRQTGKVLAVDRQTAVVVDLTEQLAGKAALSEAAAKIAERLLPKLVK
jgi:TolB-like protein